MKPVDGLRVVVATMLVLGALCPPRAMAQPRYYWKTLSGANGVPLIVESIDGNTNPFDPSLAVTPGAQFNATLALAGYAHFFSLKDRAAMVAYIQPMGRISGDVNIGGSMVNQSAHGFGDPMIEFDVDCIGPKAEKNIPDLIRYQPGFSADLLADLAFPIGEYSSGQPLNLGQNRWYGRLGAPIVAQIGEWVPGRRTTLEFIPGVWLFGTNDDYVGQTLKTDPMFQLDAHLTHDFTEHFWGSFDGIWYKGGQPTIGGVAGKPLDNLGFGLTLGNQINDNLTFTFGYKSTINDQAPDALRMDVFNATLIVGWHSLLEGTKRLKGAE